MPTVKYAIPDQFMLLRFNRRDVSTPNSTIRITDHKLTNYHYAYFLDGSRLIREFCGFHVTYPTCLRSGQRHILARNSYWCVACWSVCEREQDFWSAKSVLDHLIVSFWGFWLLDFQWVKGQTAVVCSWSADFCSSEATLMSWLPLKGFDCLV